MSVRARVLLVPRPLPQTSISFCRITTLSFIVSFIAHFRQLLVVARTGAARTGRTRAGRLGLRRLGPGGLGLDRQGTNLFYRLIGYDRVRAQAPALHWFYFSYFKDVPGEFCVDPLFEGELFRNHVRVSEMIYDVFFGKFSVHVFGPVDLHIDDSTDERV